MAEAPELEGRGELTDEQAEQLWALYQREWWSEGRTLEDVRHMLEDTGVVVALCGKDDGRLYAFARVITDYVYRGTLYDVIVSEELRGTGIGKRLLNEVVNHPKLARVEIIELYCRPEHVPFYARWGWSTELGPVHAMRRRSEDATGRAAGRG
jgi:GNAT superfamily N-acetyltransferase